MAHDLLIRMRNERRESAVGKPAPTLPDWWFGMQLDLSPRKLPLLSGCFWPGA